LVNYFSSPTRLFKWPSVVFEGTTVGGGTGNDIDGGAVDVSIGGVTTRDATYDATLAANAGSRALAVGADGGACLASDGTVNWNLLGLIDTTL